MKSCIKCGSFAVNEHLYDRIAGVDDDLCDVHYWHKRAAELKKDAARYQWLADYLNHDDCSFDDALCNASTKDQIDAVIDAAIEKEKDAAH